ncbi:MAG: hypothetical protein E5W91_18060 [Mesorhizobium sp.]|nr:MAG: hypothetical protein E5W91_18060 [Mesorhizobium sp.]
MSPKSAPRFWDNDMHENKTQRAVCLERFSAPHNGRAFTKTKVKFGRGCEPSGIGQLTNRPPTV